LCDSGGQGHCALQEGDQYRSRARNARQRADVALTRVHQDGPVGRGEVEAVIEGAEPDDDRRLIRSVILEEEARRLAEPMHLEGRITRRVWNRRCTPLQKLA